MSLILASTSVYRKSLLEKIGLKFDCESPNVEEYSLLNEDAEQMCERLAIQKARAVAKRYDNGIIIGSDQAASLGNKILGKPGNQANAVKQLLQCNGKTVRFYTGLCIIDANNGKQKSLVDTFDVVFRELSVAQIEHYVETEKPFDCAGSFKSEGLGICLFQSLNGRDPNTLIGLPLIALCDLLPEFGIQILQNH